MSHKFARLVVRAIVGMAEGAVSLISSKCTGQPVQSKQAIDNETVSYQKGFQAGEAGKRKPLIPSDKATSFFFNQELEMQAYDRGYQDGQDMRRRKMTGRVNWFP